MMLGALYLVAVGVYTFHLVILSLVKLGEATQEKSNGNKDPLSREIPSLQEESDPKCQSIMGNATCQTRNKEEEPSAADGGGTVVSFGSGAIWISFYQNTKTQQ